MRYMRGSMFVYVLLTGAALAGYPDLGQSTEVDDARDANLELTAGAVAVGIGYTWAHGDGVFIKLLSTDQGIRFNLAGSGVSVKLDS